MLRKKGIWRATTRPRRARPRTNGSGLGSFQARMEEFGRTAESADAAARDAGAEAEGAVRAAFAARDSALAEAANARARAVMLDEQLRDLRQQVERGDPFVLVDGDDDDFVSLGRDDGVRLDLEALRAAPSFGTATSSLVSFFGCCTFYLVSYRR